MEGYNFEISIVKHVDHNSKTYPKETRQTQRLIQRKQDKQNLNSNVKNKLPDVIIVGVKKSGTMTLGKSYL